MISYCFYQKNPASHYVYIDLTIDTLNAEQLQLQLPSWRPGRYELGNFAKNIKRVDIVNEKNETLTYTKTSKDLWQVDTKSSQSIKVTYSYYAAELNAGACFADTTQIYINPVHCCLYVPNRMEEEHRITVQVPDHYRLVCSLPMEGKTLIAGSYDELADSPFIAGTRLQSDVYTVKGISFHIHFNGVCKPDWKKIKTDFLAFTDKLITFWKDFPYQDYHFIVQVLPNKFYHGVEHKKNTVIAIGPGYELNRGLTYEDLLGVSCHELFHVWNIKTIRPKEMQPYDYTRENYARTGYVYEGFTTYYGDKLLLSAGVFTLDQYFITLEERLQKHFHNYGRYNLSVAQSSWETWLDGYVAGAPYRKTNIYDEGNLIAFMLDVKILKSSGNKKSLRDVCVLLYERFGKTGKGYSEEDIVSVVNEVGSQDFSDFFSNYVYGTSDFETPLTECFTGLGITFSKAASPHESEHSYGFKTVENGLITKVTLVAPYSPAWKAGLFAGDDIIAVQDMVLKNNLNAWLSYFSDQPEIEMTVNSGEELKKIRISKDKKGNTFFFQPKLSLNEKQDAVQKATFEIWKQF